MLKLIRRPSIGFSYLATDEVYQCVIDELQRRDGCVTVYSVQPILKYCLSWIVFEWAEHIIKRSPELIPIRCSECGSTLWRIEFITRERYESEKGKITNNRRENEYQRKQTRFAL